MPDVYPNDKYFYYVGVDDAALQMQLPPASYSLLMDEGFLIWLHPHVEYDEPTINNQTGMPSAWCTDGKEYVLIDNVLGTRSQLFGR